MAPTPGTRQTPGESVLTPRHMMYCYRSVTQIPQCTGPTSINAPFCDRNVCTFLLQNVALWYICLMHCGIYGMSLLGHHPYWHSYNHRGDSDSHRINTLRPRQDGRHFPDDIFKCIFLNENARISHNKWLKFVPKVQVNNISALIQIMAWRRSGDKPLSEPMVVSLLTHICVTRPQWVNTATTSVLIPWQQLY